MAVTPPRKAKLPHLMLEQRFTDSHNARIQCRSDPERLPQQTVQRFLHKLSPPVIVNKIDYLANLPADIFSPMAFSPATSGDKSGRLAPSTEYIIISHVKYW